MKRTSRTGKATGKVPRAGSDEAEGQKQFDDLIGWLAHLQEAPQFRGVLDLYSGGPYAAALNIAGNLYVGALRRLACAGRREAVKRLVRAACDMTGALEEIAATNPGLLREFGDQRADWPVMLCRHESSSKLVSALLDDIGLGNGCLINADGRHVAKYSLRTPINRYVWRVLKGLRFSIKLMADVPKVAAIDYAALPRLTKGTAKVWADKALMPYIDGMNPDYSEVPEFKAILARPQVRTRGQQRREIRKDVIRALQALAPPA